MFNLWSFILLELLKLAKNATLKDVLDEIKKNRKFSKNEALFCKQKESENMDGASQNIHWNVPLSFDFQPVPHQKTAEFIEIQATIFFILKTSTKKRLSIWFFSYFIIFSPIWKHLSQHNSRLGLTFDP